MPNERAASASALLNLVEGHRVTAVLCTAAELGIADLLFEGPKTLAQLTHLTDTHERSLRRLLRALVTLEICTEMADGRLALTELGTHLAGKADRSLKAWALLEGGMLRARWGSAHRVDPNGQDSRRACWVRPGTLRGDRENEGCCLVQRSHGLHDAVGDPGHPFGV